jgi:transposase
MRGEVLGVERRRRWSDDEKLSIVMAVGVDGATVTQVAQRHEITRQQIYAWRHALKRKGLWPVEDGAVFLPLDIGAAHGTEPSIHSSEAGPEFIEIALTKGRQLRVSSSLGDATLARLIRVVEAA